MCEYKRSAQTSASPQRVWSIWSDTSRWQEWNPTVKSMKLQGDFKAGSTATMETTEGRTHAMTIESIDPERSFVLGTAVIPGTRFHFRCEITPLDGGSHISQGISMSGPLAWLVAPLMGNQIAKTFIPIVASLAKKAESPQTP
jgi:uncharacterized protein YndB with AHSA1/START domain